MTNAGAASELKTPLSNVCEEARCLDEATPTTRPGTSDS